MKFFVNLNSQASRKEIKFFFFLKKYLQTSIRTTILTVLTYTFKLLFFLKKKI